MIQFNFNKKYMTQNMKRNYLSDFFGVVYKFVCQVSLGEVLALLSTQGSVSAKFCGQGSCCHNWELGGDEFKKRCFQLSRTKR